MRGFFEKITSNEPYAYQAKVMEVLLSGKNVILSVPTGAGKTWASIIPFLYAQDQNDLSFPKKLIYSSPLRTLTNSIYEDVSKVVEGSSIQTGEFNEDKYFEKDIIFSTIDQTLSNFLNFPLSLSKAQANINAGALIGSYLIFDEFHLLDPKRSMATTIGMLKILGSLTRCCIMTATLEDKFMKDLKDNLSNYEIITLDDFPEDKNKVSSLLPVKGKKKIHVLSSKISAKTIADKHSTKSIVICNRVESAQKVYKDIIGLKDTHPNLKRINPSNIICLHSRFFENDRKEKEQKLKALFGKKNDKDESAILIATQVIEAGMDLSCEVMHTEISPINSFLQRAGRCARFKNEKGEIYIYDVLDVEEKISLNIAKKEADKKEINKINNKYLPYSAKECKAAMEELSQYENLDDNNPYEMIESIAQKFEVDLIGNMKMMSGGGFNQGKIKDSWDSCEKNYYRDTIRDIQSVEITLINETLIDDINKYPFKFQSLGMYKWSLVSWLNKVQKNEVYLSLEEDDWLVMSLELADDMFLENDEDEKYELKIISPENYKNLPNQVYLNAKYFGYDKGFGLNWEYPETFKFISPERELKEDEEVFKPLTKDTFYEHNKGLLKVFERNFLPYQDFIFKELPNYLQLPEFKKDDIIMLTKLMIALHDYGKLNEKWQLPMQEYQGIKEKSIQKKYNEVLAHTDYDSTDEKDVELGKSCGLNKRPPHAGVGAYVLQEIIEEIFDNDLIKGAISMAIARHHSSLSISYPDFNISDKNYLEIKKLLDELEMDFDLEQNEYGGYLEGFETDGHHEKILYFYFVRILRMCDQEATRNLKKYYNKTDYELH